MAESESQTKNGSRKVVAKCPKCGSLVDATYLAFDHLDKLGVWNGMEDCWECSTSLSFSVTLDKEGNAIVRCEKA